jgi:hypothetical protein
VHQFAELLYAGVLADRLDRRAIVIATGLVRVAILLLLTASILAPPRGPDDGTTESGQRAEPFDPADRP